MSSHVSTCKHTQCSQQCLRKGRLCREGSSAFDRDAAEGPGAQCEYIQRSHQACAKGDNAEKALQRWVEMQRKGLEPQ